VLAPRICDVTCDMCEPKEGSWQRQTTKDVVKATEGAHISISVFLYGSMVVACLAQRLALGTLNSAPMHIVQYFPSCRHRTKLHILVQWEDASTQLRTPESGGEVLAPFPSSTVVVNLARTNYTGQYCAISWSAILSPMHVRADSGECLVSRSSRVADIRPTQKAHLSPSDARGTRALGAAKRCAKAQRHWATSAADGQGRPVHSAEEAKEDSKPLTHYSEGTGPTTGPPSTGPPSTLAREHRKREPPPTHNLTATPPWIPACFLSCTQQNTHPNPYPSIHGA